MGYFLIIIPIVVFVAIWGIRYRMRRYKITRDYILKHDPSKKELLEKLNSQDPNWIRKVNKKLIE
ncbi:MAG TPA: hypothetical protein VJB98_00540 [Candidatus Paceibacterota bacterium]